MIGFLFRQATAFHLQSESTVLMLKKKVICDRKICRL